MNKLQKLIELEQQSKEILDELFLLLESTGEVSVLTTGIELRGRTGHYFFMTHAEAKRVVDWLNGVYSDD